MDIFKVLLTEQSHFRTKEERKKQGHTLSTREDVETLYPGE